MRRIRWLLAVVAAFAMLPVGAAAAHGYDCWTAGPGYTVTCGPKSHSDYDPIQGTLLYTFSTFIRYSQTNLGSFDWLNIRLGDGHSPSGQGEYGTTTIYKYPGGGTVFYTDWWLCKLVGSIQYDELTVWANNPTTQGTWYQWVYISSCLSATRSPHTMNVNAY